MIYRQLSEINKEDYFLVTYYLESFTNLADASWAVGVGQSVGNPNVRNEWETDELFEKHSCKIIDSEERLKGLKSGSVVIAFPVVNIDFNTDGVSHCLVQIFGGQLDIDIIEKCHIKDIEFPQSVLSSFKGPKFGISGIREFTKVKSGPVLGSIIKPKTGISKHVLLDMVKQLVEGGI